MRNLDGPRTFTGKEVGDHIQFTRDGREQSLSVTDGDGTGMKWLAGKSDCLVIKPGEGFCSD